MTGRFLAPGVVLMLAVSGRAPAQDLPASERYVVRAEYTRWGANLSGHAVTDKVKIRLGNLNHHLQGLHGPD